MPNRFAVMGNPIAHSLSPFIHHCFAEQTGKQLRYEKIKVDEASFEDHVFNFFAQGGRGLNITLPFKQRAFVMAKKATDRCMQAKAANTLWLDAAGHLQADNTDGVGLIRDLSHHISLEAKQVLLLGAGGAARGIVGPLLAANIAQLTIANRTVEKTKALQIDFPQIKGITLSELKDNYDLILNATSASLTAKLPVLPSSVLQNAPFCYDLAYCVKGLTSFVVWAREQGCAAMDGLGMLVEQAAESFFIWHGLKPDTESVLTALRKETM